VTTETLATASSQETVQPYVQSLLLQIGFHQFAFHRNVDGVGHEESLRPPEPGGNCLNWVVGHLVLARQGWLSTVLGMAPALDPARMQTYKRGSSPLVDGTLALPFAELIEIFDRSQGPLVEGMSMLRPERLAEKAPFSPGNDPNETVGSLVPKLCFHEGYHIGQTGLLRRLLGLAGGIA
jgi:hypothetical protein